MPAQMAYFTNRGMYRDPGDPITYDLTTRIQFSIALDAGAGGDLRETIAEHLRRGALTSLVLVSPGGLVPYGGRSSQYNFQEVMVAVVCEMEATRLAATDPERAGLFKRQAHLSTTSIQPWLAMQPFRNLKNAFPPGDRHGFDAYGKYAVYSLLIASMCALAARVADDTIAERASSAEVGSYVFELAPAFHKIIAVCGDTQVVIDTSGDPQYDATGLGRITHAQTPIGLGLGMPLCAEPSYNVPAELTPDIPTTIGPEWYDGSSWVRLAATTPTPMQRLANVRTKADVVQFSVQWDGDLREHYRVSDGQLQYRVESPQPCRLLVPIIVSDGSQESQIDLGGTDLTVHLGGHSLTVSAADGAQLELDDQRCANRHGIYRLLRQQQRDPWVHLRQGPCHHMRCSYLAPSHQRWRWFRRHAPGDVPTSRLNALMNVANSP